MGSWCSTKNNEFSVRSLPVSNSIVSIQSKQSIMDEISELRGLTYRNTPTFSFAGMSFTAKCVKVYDGDTVTVAFKFKDIHYKKSARVNRIDAPEMYPKLQDYYDFKQKNPKIDINNHIKLEKIWAVESKKLLTHLVFDKIITVNCIDNKKDKYGRLLVELDLLNGENVNDIMLNFGYCRPYDGGKKEVWDFAGFNHLKQCNSSKYKI
jgi:endonuclease YncB( thermonuclease family)